MLKLLLAALLIAAAAAAPALAANPTATLTVQVVPAGSASVCSSPAVPHPAQAAGFTTLAYCADFTQETAMNNVVNHTTGTMAWHTLANWLDCAGAGSPQWSLNNVIGHANNCADISVANDPTAGSNTLILTVTPSDVPSPTFTLGIATAANGNYLMVYPGTNNYAEVKYRISTAEAANMPVQSNIFFDFWSEYQSGCGTEVDFIETFAGTSYSMQGLTDWCGSNTTSGGALTGPSDSNYHILGSLNTSNRSSGPIGQCSYTDGSATLANGGGAQTCQSTTPVNSVSYTQGSYLLLWNNASYGASTPAVTGNVHVWIEWIRVWSCAGWALGTPNSPSNNCSTSSPYIGTPP